MMAAVMPGIRLGVNIDHIATLRQVRLTDYPDPVAAAVVAMQAGADLITVHLREDRRHIQEADVAALLRQRIGPVNLEMAVVEPMVEQACQLRPEYCCLVPERRAELTTEGGLDVAGNRTAVAAACKRLHSAGIRVSLFIDPERAQVQCAVALGVPAVELHTGRYAEAGDTSSRRAELDRLAAAAASVVQAGMAVHAGHGLHYHNTAAVVGLPGLQELNIGHGIVARAVFTGLHRAVADMRALIDQGGTA